MTSSKETYPSAARCLLVMKVIAIFPCEGSGAVDLVIWYVQSYRQVMISIPS